MISHANAAPQSMLMDSTLPWDKLPGENARLNSALILLLLLALLFILVVEHTVIPPKPRVEQAKVPERLAKLVMERKKVIPPPPKPKPQKQEEKKKEPEKKKPEPKPEEKPKEKPTEAQVNKARAKAKKEVQVFQDALSGLRDLAPEPAAGNQKLRTGGGQATKITRDLITSRAGEGSGGIAISNVSSGGGGSGKVGNLHAGGMTAVSSSIGEGAARQAARQASGGISARTDEQIRRVFDRYAGRINSLYQRELRSNPTLQGQVILHMVIAPSGEVTSVKVKSSELHDPGLEEKIKLIVSTMNFGAMKVKTWEGDYPLNFFPS